MAVSKNSYKWLDRRIAAPGPYLTLCLSEKEFKSALKALRISENPPWILNDHADATVHHLFSVKGDQACVVCLRDTHGRNPIEVAGLLVHEAVHIWQEYCDYYGERNPGREQEAYAIQAISQELMAEYARRIQ